MRFTEATDGMLRIGVVGLGAWGGRLLRVFSNLKRSRIVALCDCKPTLLSERLHQLPILAENRYGGATLGVAAFSDPAAIFRAGILDAVVIATPPQSHAELACDALRNGLHVFVEKPLATSLADALAIESAGRVAERVVMVGHILEHHPAVSALAQCIKRGELGQPQTWLSHRLGAARREESAWWSLAPHDIGLLRRFLGEPESIELTRRPDRQDHWLAKLRLPGGRQARIEVASDHPHKTRQITLVGSRAIACFDDLSKQAPLRIRQRAPGAEWRTIAVDGQEPLTLEAQAFESAILDGQRPIANARSGVEVVRWLEAGDQSRHSGAEVRRYPTSTVNGRAPLLQVVVEHRFPMLQESVDSRHSILGNLEEAHAHPRSPGGPFRVLAHPTYLAFAPNRLGRSRKMQNELDLRTHRHEAMSCDEHPSRG